MPDELVIGPGVPALFIGMFIGIDLAAQHIYPVEADYWKAVKAYEKEEAAYQKALTSQPDPIVLEEDEESVTVGDITVPRHL